jgi:hypothetical protein
MTSIDLQDSVVTLGILRTLIDCTFFDRRQTQRVVWRELICRDTTFSTAWNKIIYI